MLFLFTTDATDNNIEYQLSIKCKQDALLLQRLRYDTITRCYFNVRSKADISQLNLPHGTDN